MGYVSGVSWLPVFREVVKVVIPVGGEGGVLVSVLLGGKRKAVMWEEREVEVTSQEDAGVMVRKDNGLEGVEDVDGFGGGEVGVEVCVDDGELVRV